MRWTVLAAALLVLAGCLAPASTPGQLAVDETGEIAHASEEARQEDDDATAETEDAPAEAETETETETETNSSGNRHSNGASDTARPPDMADFLPPSAPIPPALRTSQAACERDGGRFAPRSGGRVYDCLRITRDAGQSCRRAGDCEGLCLARSGSCAPFTPLLGCHEVLDSGGGRMTQCIE